MNYSLSLVLLTIGVFTSCNKNNDSEPIQAKKHRTVIEYVVADNSLYSYSLADINEMESAWDNAIDGHLVVYFYPVANSNGNDEPRLLLILNDNDPNVINSKILKKYSRDQHPNDPDVMSLVIDDAMRLAPAESYGLVFWSHGSGWIPDPLKPTLPLVGDPAWAGSKLEGMAQNDNSTNERTSANGTVGYSFGDGSYSPGGKYSMEIDEMAKALPSNIVFDFILFDACHMACVEVAWELQGNTKYLISATAETMAAGFPDKDIIAPMFASGEADVVKIASEFYDHYNALSGSMRTATVSVVKSDALPALAATVKELSSIALTPNGLYYAGQQYGRTATGFNNIFYDLGDFISNTWKHAPSQVASFNSAMDAAVIYKAATPWIISSIKVTNHSGLSCYIPRTTEPLSLKAYQTRFGWSVASGMGSIVPQVE